MGKLIRKPSYLTCGVDPMFTFDTLHHLGFKIFIRITFLTQRTIVALVPVFSTRCAHRKPTSPLFVSGISSRSTTTIRTLNTASAKLKKKVMLYIHSTPSKCLKRPFVRDRVKKYSTLCKTLEVTYTGLLMQHKLQTTSSVDYTVGNRLFADQKH